MADPNQYMGGISAISGYFSSYFVALAALGVLTAGIVEAYKKIANTLQRFHQKAVLRWLSEEIRTQPGLIQPISTIKFGGHYGIGESVSTKSAKTIAAYDHRVAYAELLHLTTGLRIVSLGRDDKTFDQSFVRNIGYALFELETARMMSQIQDAADAALNNPKLYPNWFAFLTRGCREDDVHKWCEALGNPSSATLPAREDVAAVYGRIRLLMRRQLDSFQTVTLYRWREWNQLWAWLVGGILFFLSLIIGELKPSDLNSFLSGAFNLEGLTYLKNIALACAGGLLAPVAKDLAESLTSLKAKPNA